MTSDPVGVGLLVTAVVAGVGAAGVALTPARPSGAWLMRAAAAALWAAVGLLAIAVLGQDTRLAYVADQTSDDLSPLLRFSALWAGAEGSLLLFAAMVATALVVGHRQAPAWQQVGAGAVTAGLAATSVLAADPFVVLDLPPLSGAGMAPILEHWAMVVHPPLLYLGLCLALVPATMRHPMSAHRWGLAALAVLTVALGLGSAWAYVELGWGGWWAWDPIENVALVVWLVLAAGLHWRPLDPDRQTGSGMVNLVVVHALCWPAVLAGAALTRTSLRTSVHAFADAAGLAAWLWPLTVLAVIGAGLRIWEANRDAATFNHAPSTQARTTGSPVSTVSTVSTAPVVMLLLAGLIVAAGTYRPFIGGDGTAGWFYSQALFPLAVVGAVAIGLVPALRHRLGRANVVAPAAGVMGAVGAGLVGWSAWWQVVLAAALATGTVLVLSSVADRRLIGVARTTGHLGMLAVVSAALAGTGSTESAVRLTIGESVEVDGHQLRLLATELIEADDRTGNDQARVEATVLVDGNHVMVPSVTFYPDRGLRLPEVATRTRPWLDTQIVLRDVDATDGALLTVLFRPWNQLVWWGVALMALAALLGSINAGRAWPSRADPSTSAPGPQRRGREAVPVVDRPDGPRSTDR